VKNPVESPLNKAVDVDKTAADKQADVVVAKKTAPANKQQKKTVEKCDSRV